MFSAFSCHEKIPSFAKKATAQTVASNNIIAYGIFRFHEGMSICRFHELSHSCASLLLANGVPLKQIQDWLGHSDFSTTANIYAHLDYSSKLSSAKAMVNGMALPETVNFGSKWETVEKNCRE